MPNWVETNIDSITDNSAPAAKLVTDFGGSTIPDQGAPPLPAALTADGVAAKIASANKGEEPPKAPESNFSPKFAAIARREKELRAKEKTLKEQEERLKATTLNQGRLKSEPLKVLEEAGVTYEQLTQHLMQGGKLTPEQAVKYAEQQVQQLRQELADKDKQQAEQHAAAQGREAKLTETRIRNEAAQFVEAEKANYELIEMFGVKEQIYDHIEKHFRETYNQETDTGEVWSVKQAADDMENQLAELWSRGLKSQKLQAKLQPSITSRPVAPTISQRMTTQTSSAPVVQPQGIPSREERYQRAQQAVSQILRRSSV